MAIVFRGGPELVTRSRDGRNFVLLEAKELVSDSGAIYQIPVGAESDGASTPQELWSTGLTPFGVWWPAAFAHDSAYRGTLLRQTVDGPWLPAMLPKDQCDLLLLDCMSALGVEQAIKEAIYEGVRFGGWSSFEKDRG